MAPIATESRDSLRAVVRVLGGRAVLGRVVIRPDQAIDLVRDGIPVDALRRLAGVIDSPVRRVAELVGISARTLARRMRQRGAVLDVAESDRLLRLAGAVALAEDVLGSEAKAVRWLRAGNRALGGEEPQSIPELARRSGVTVALLEQLLPALRRGKLVESRRGVKGGYRLARDAAQINALQITEAVDGDQGLASDRLSPWDSVVNGLRGELESLDLAGLAAARKDLADGPMYYI